MLHWERFFVARDRERAQGAAIAVAGIETLVGFLPGVGEAMDVLVLVDGRYDSTDKMIAGGSLVLNLITFGFAPNAGKGATTIRAIHKMDDFDDLDPRVFQSWRKLSDQEIYAPNSSRQLLDEYEWVLVRNNTENQRRLGKLYNAMLQDFKRRGGVIDPDKMKLIGRADNGNIINGRYLFKNANEIELFQGRTFGTRMEELLHFEQVKTLRRRHPSLSDAEIEYLIPRLEREAKAKLEAWGFMRLPVE